jgi:hypothetical protein
VLLQLLQKVMPALEPYCCSLQACCHLLLLLLLLLLLGSLSACLPLDLACQQQQQQQVLQLYQVRACHGSSYCCHLHQPYHLHPAAALHC